MQPGRAQTYVAMAEWDREEERWVAIGSLESRLVAVIFTRRADVIRIISARRARKNEEIEYHNAKVGRPPKG